MEDAVIIITGGHRGGNSNNAYQWTGDGTWTYGYDGSNRLKSAARTGFSATLYVYVGNDPVNRIDPDGLDTLQVGIAVGGVFLGVGVPQTGAGFAFDTQGNIGGYVSSGVGG